MEGVLLIGGTFGGMISISPLHFYFIAFAIIRTNRRINFATS
jgi:hypothetical protein